MYLYANLLTCDILKFDLLELNGATNDGNEISIFIFNYRPQTKFAKVMFLQVCVCPQGGVNASRGGMHASWGACMLPRGVRGCRGRHVWLQGGMRGIRQDTVNEQAVRILLECILVHV